MIKMILFPRVFSCLLFIISWWRASSSSVSVNLQITSLNWKDLSLAHSCIQPMQAPDSNHPSFIKDHSLSNVMQLPWMTFLDQVPIWMVPSRAEYWMPKPVQKPCSFILPSQMLPDLQNARTRPLGIPASWRYYPRKTNSSPRLFFMYFNYF